jgi:hypothetical protein
MLRDRTNRATPIAAPPTSSLLHFQHRLIIPHLLFLMPQLIHSLPTSSTIPNSFAINHGFSQVAALVAREFVLADLALAVKVGARYVKGMDVAGEDACNEEESVNEGIGSYPSDLMLYVREA